MGVDPSSTCGARLLAILVAAVLFDIFALAPASPAAVVVVIQNHARSARFARLLQATTLELVGSVVKWRRLRRDDRHRLLLQRG